jgi:hypothetical protein
MKTSLLSLFLLLGCAGPRAQLVVLLEAESTISDGLDPGSDEESVVDGWSVRYERFLLSIGDVAVARSDTREMALDDREHVVEMRLLPASGYVLARFDALSSGRWNQFGYRFARASAQSERDPSVTQADFDAMASGGLTYWIRGTLENPSGESCPPAGTCRSATSVAFDLRVPVGTTLHDCVDESESAGVVVPNSGSASVSTTIHGDHLFFDAFPTGAEIIHRRAQWLANADTNGDGTTTTDELAAIDASRLLPSSTHNLANAPVPINTALDFVRAQLSSQGHLQGEGDCIWQIDP